MRAPCPKSGLLDLAAGNLPPDEAALLSRHVAACAQCTAALRDADDVLHAAASVAKAQESAAAISDEVRDRMWANLAPVAEVAAENARTHAAVRHLARSRYGAMAAAAVVLFAAASFWSVRALQREPVPHQAKAEVAQTAVAHAVPAPVVAQPRPAEAPPVVEVVHADPSPPATPERAPHATVLHLACGAAVHHPGADVRVVRDEPGNGVVRLTAGTVRVEVPKLPAGARMAVETAAAHVEVKGTHFSVSHAADGTTVRVTDGTVWVTPVGKGRPLEVLTAGQTTLVPGVDVYCSDLRQKLKAALGAKSWPEVAKLAHRLLDTLDEGTEADGLRLQLAAVAARDGEDVQAVVLAEQVALHGALDLTRQNALVFEANVQHSAKHVAAETNVWQRYRQEYPNGAHIGQALERLVQLTCGQTTAEAGAYRQQLRAQGRQDDEKTDLLARCEPSAR